MGDFHWRQLYFFHISHVQYVYQVIFSYKLSFTSKQALHGDVHLFLFGRTQNNLSQTRLFSWNITPFLDNWLLDSSGIGSGPGTDFFGDINTLLCRVQLWNKLGDMLACSLRLKITVLLGSILDNSLDFIIAFFCTLLESTSGRSTNFPANYCLKILKG